MDKDKIIEAQLAQLHKMKHHYMANPDQRGTDEAGDCCYLTAKGQMCAIGRLMTEAALKELGDSRMGAQQIVADFVNREAPLFKDEQAQSIISSVSFWCRLQALHDDNKNWCRDGLTETGKLLFNNEEQNIKKNDYIKLETIKEPATV